MIRFFARAASAAAILAAMAVPAFAHITLDVGAAPVGSSYKAVLRVPHGCDGTATTAIRLKVPEGFVSAKPMPKPGWTLDIKTGAYAKSYTLFGSPVTQGATEISWSGGNLPDSEYDEFVVRGTLAADLPVGSILYFPVIQMCGAAEEDWIDTSGSDAGTPAPGLKLTAPVGGDD
jgi:uncharacterized protein YcnI